MCAYVPLKLSTRGSRNRGVRPTFHEEQFLTSTDKYMAPDEHDKTTRKLYSEALSYQCTRGFDFESEDERK